MDSAQIATLLTPYLTRPLTPAQLVQISTYIDLLLRWNARTNLSAIRTPEEIVTRHFGESLFAAQTLFSYEGDPENELKDEKRDQNDGDTNDKIPREIVILSEAKDPLLAGGASRPAPPPHSSRAEASVPPAGPGQMTDKEPSPHPTPSPAGTAENNLALQRRDPPTQEKRPVSTPETPHHLNANAARLDLLDVGSGPGFPGLPIHLATPNLQTTLLESQQKKVAFLREVIRTLTLTNINVSPARAEDFPHAASTVTLRAVERFDRILPVAARLVAPQGRLTLLIAEPQRSRAEVALPNFTWHSPISIPNSTTRILLVGTPN